MESLVQNVHTSRFGFHSCDYATYRKLKEINKVLTKARSMRAAWLRWAKKLPHNRVMRKRIRNAAGQVVGFQPPVALSEPSYDNLFLVKSNITSSHDINGVHPYGYFSDKKLNYDLVDFDPNYAFLYILEDYRIARTPFSKPEDVIPLHYSVEEIDAMYQKIV